MSIDRLSAKVGKKGSAGGHARYITRQEQYANSGDSDERVYVGKGNLPVWCNGDPIAFFDASDLFERANGSTYKEWEIALPRELSDDQLKALIEDFIAEQIGERFPYLYGIHIPKASDGGEQPHCHLMFSERELDGIERSRETFFKRANTKNPEKGGCKKANTGLKSSERKELLYAVRSDWAVTCNKHLVAAGFEPTVDMRSYAERGIDKIPEPKMQPGEKYGRGRAEVIDYFEAKKEWQAARAEVERLIPDMGAEIISLRAEREAREAAKKQPFAAVTEVQQSSNDDDFDKALGAAFAALAERENHNIQEVIEVKEDRFTEEIDLADDPLAQSSKPKIKGLE